MLARAIYGVGAAEGVDAAQYISCAARGDVVSIDRYDVAAGNGLCFTAVTMQGTCYESPHILKVVLLGLGQIEVCGKRLYATRRGAQALDEL
ncbi:MAG: hypothetical protein VB034_07385 [Eubacteriales bacterium]|nr:hypothetical protein [Eubacteriales bacterium]